MYRPKKRHLLALELIPEGSSISWGGSMSIKAIGLPEALHKGNYKVLDRDLCATPEGKSRDDASGI